MTNKSLPSCRDHETTVRHAWVGIPLFDVEIENSFAFLSRDYADLFAVSAATPFQHPVWLDRLYAMLVPQLGAEPLIVVVRARSDGRPVLVLPLVRRRLGGILRLIEFADLRVSDYASPVCEAHTLHSLLADKAAVERIRKVIKPFDLLRIKNVRDDGLLIERLVAAPPRAPMNMSAHAVPLVAPYDAWRSQMISASYRKELDKKSRQLHRKGEVRFGAAADAKAIVATFRGMQEFRRPRFGESGGDLLQNEGYFKFYTEVAIAGRGGFARTYAMSMDDRPIAGVLGLSHAGRLLVILGGFDQAGYKNQSIGALMFQAVAEDAIAKGETELDFTIGDEPYKRLFGAVPMPMWMVSKSGGPLGSFATFAITRLPWAKAMAKKLSSDPVPVAGDHPTG
jgi:CelD/BcsL family acetyltransferase involved in cellulose biosynthesis